MLLLLLVAVLGILSGLEHFASASQEDDGAVRAVLQSLGNASSPEYAAAIKRSKCSTKCFENGSCNEELGRCDCVKGWRGKDCSEVGSIYSCTCSPTD